MSDYKKFLPKKKAKAAITGIMVRPDKDICAFLMKTADEHGCSVNQLVIAFIKEKFEELK